MNASVSQAELMAPFHELVASKTLEFRSAVDVRVVLRGMGLRTISMMKPEKLELGSRV